MLDKLTLRDLRELRDHTGKSDLEEIFAPLQGDSFNLDSIEVIQYLIYLVRRKTQSDYSLNDALNVPLDELREFMNDDPLAAKTDTGESPSSE